MKKWLILFLVIGIFSCRKTDVDFKDCDIILGNVLFNKSLNQGRQNIQIDSTGKISMFSGPKTDYFNEPDGSAKYSNAPMILKNVDSGKPFTFTIKLKPQFKETYDAGAIYLFQDNNHWVKFAFEMDENRQTRLVTVRTNEYSDDNNHEIYSEPEILLKISSDTKSIGYYFSKDSIHWNLVRVHKNDFKDVYYLGISSQSPLGGGTVTQFWDANWINNAVKDFRKGQ